VLTTQIDTLESGHFVVLHDLETAKVKFRHTLYVDNSLFRQQFTLIRSNYVGNQQLSSILDSRL
jgi:hypothetical protein